MQLNETTPTTPAPSAIKRIVTFHLNGLGDLLFTLPSLLALRETFPGAAICAVVRPALAPLLQDSPLVDEVWLRPKKAAAQWKLAARLRAGRFDMAVTFSQSLPSILLARATGARVRAGFEPARLSNLLTHRAPRPRNGPFTIEQHLGIVRALGCSIPRSDYGDLVSVAPRHEQQAKTLLAEHGITLPFLLVACEASLQRGIKEWPEEHWAQALSDLAADWPIVLVGTRTSEAVTDRLPELQNRIIDLGGQTDLPTLAALCGQARAFLGIDSGVLHLAAAMQVPVVGIYGPTDWRLTGPRIQAHRIVRHPVECSPCLLSRCLWTGSEERKCLTRLMSSSVSDAAREIIHLGEMPS